MATATMRKGEEQLTEQVRDLRAQGYSIQDTALKLNKPVSTVQRISGRLNVKPKRTPAPEIKVMLTPEHETELRTIAKERGLVVPMGRRSGEGDLGALLALIAAGELVLVRAKN